MADRKKPELAMNWSRTEGDLVIRLNGGGTEDGKLVAEFLAVLVSYLQLVGYDRNTLRFSIRKKTGGANE